jgi:predicted GNAT family acetyltransferase
MFHVKNMKLEDLPFAVSLANTMNWHMSKQDFEFNMALEPNGCFVLLDDSEQVGLATCVSYGRVGWFGNLVGKEAYRKRGAGTAIVNHALSYLKRAGTATVGLYAYPHLTDFYGKLGFKSDVEFVMLKTNAVSALPATVGDLKKLSPPDMRGVVDFDGGCFGAPRKKLLDAILHSPDNLGYVAMGGHGMIGFGAAKVFGEAAEVGPLVCKKSHPETAVNLLNAVLSELTGLEAYLYLPVAETGLLDAAVKAGFREEFRLQRMFFGDAVAKNCIYLAESLERG